MKHYDLVSNIKIIFTGKNANLPDKTPELTCNMPLTVSFFKFPQSGRLSSITKKI